MASNRKIIIKKVEEEKNPEISSHFVGNTAIRGSLIDEVLLSNQTLVVCTFEGSDAIHIWAIDLKRKREHLVITFQSQIIPSFMLPCSDNTILIGLSSGDVHLIDPSKSFYPILSTIRMGERVYAAAFFPGERQVICQLWDRTECWSLLTKKMLQRVEMKVDVYDARIAILNPDKNEMYLIKVNFGSDIKLELRNVESLDVVLRTYNTDKDAELMPFAEPQIWNLGRSFRFRSAYFVAEGERSDLHCQIIIQDWDLRNPDPINTFRIPVDVDSLAPVCMLPDGSIVIQEKKKLSIVDFSDPANVVARALVPNCSYHRLQVLADGGLCAMKFGMDKFDLYHFTRVEKYYSMLRAAEEGLFERDLPSDVIDITLSYLESGAGVSEEKHFIADFKQVKDFVQSFLALEGVKPKEPKPQDLSLFQSTDLDKLLKLILEVEQKPKEATTSHVLNELKKALVNVLNNYQDRLYRRTHEKIQGSEDTLKAFEQFMCLPAGPNPNKLQLSIEQLERAIHRHTVQKPSASPNLK